MSTNYKIIHNSTPLSFGEGVGVLLKKILTLLILLPIMVVGQTQTENYVKTILFQAQAVVGEVSCSKKSGSILFWGFSKTKLRYSLMLV